MSDILRWLDARRPPMPSELRAAVAAACEASAARELPLEPAPGRNGTANGAAVAAATMPDRLAEAGLAALGRVARMASKRSTALELLAADALLTYACEAAAEAGPEALDRLTARLDYARFTTVLHPSIP